MRAIRRRLGSLRGYLGSRPGLARNVGILAGMVVAGLVAFLVILSQEDLVFPWQHREVIYADFSNAAAVAPGQHQEVRVAGVHVGEITGATVTRGGEARLRLTITDSSLHLYRNARALLQAKTPLNNMYVALNPGSPGAAPLGPGGTIPTARTTSPMEIDAILHHLGPAQQQATRILLSETDHALLHGSRYLPADLSSLSRTMGALQPVARALATRQAKIRTLVGDLTDIARATGGNDARLASLMDHAQATLRVLQANDAQVQATLAELPGTTHTMGSSLTKVKALTGQLNPFLDHLRGSAKVLPGALAQLTTTINRLGPVVHQLGPVIHDGRPLVANLRSFLDYGNPALADVAQISPLLNPTTAYLAKDMPWLNGFFYNTNSVGSVTQGHLPAVRGLVIAGPCSAPDQAGKAGCSLPGTHRSGGTP